MAFAAFAAATGVFLEAPRPPLSFRIVFAGVALGVVLFRDMVLLTGGAATRIKADSDEGVEMTLTFEIQTHGMCNFATGWRKIQR